MNENDVPDLEADDLAAIPAVEPLADEGDDHYAAIVIDSDRVQLTASLRMFLQSCRQDPRLAVVVVNAGAAISPAAMHVLNHSSALLAVRTEDGVFDGQNGQRLHGFEALWVPSDAEQHPDFTTAPQGQQAALVVEAYRTLEADDDVLIGPFADVLTSGLGAGELCRWGVDEPLTFVRNHHRLTRALQAQMPVSEPHIMAAEDGTMAAISVGRTPHGLLERVIATIPAGRFDDLDHIEQARRAGTVLTGAAEAHHVTVASVTVARVHDLGAGHCISPGLTTVPQPLAVLVGPRVVHDLGLNTSTAPSRTDIRFFGMGKSPSALVQFTNGTDGFSQLLEFVTQLDPQRVAAAYGFSPEQS